MAHQSDLAHVLQLRAHLLARPEGAYLDRQGQRCRHPGGLYSQSLAKVLTRMRELTATFEPEAHPQTLNLTWPAVMSALEGLLVAVDAHADDLKTILAATGQVPAKGLKRIGDQIDEVFEELVGRPINRVKHNGEKFEACYCYSPQFAVYGYFVAGVRDDGAVAPSKRAHGSSGTHWSFAVTIRRLLGQVVQSARVVYPHVRSTLVLEPSRWSPQERSELRSVAAWLDRCPPLCFPNEAHLRVPAIGLLGDEPYLRLNTLRRLRDVQGRSGVTWSRSFGGDGVSRQFSVM